MKLKQQNCNRGAVNFGRYALGMDDELQGFDILGIKKLIVKEAVMKTNADGFYE